MFKGLPDLISGLDKKTCCILRKIRSSTFGTGHTLNRSISGCLETRKPISLHSGSQDSVIQTDLIAGTNSAAVL